MTNAASVSADPGWLIENLTRQVPDIAHAILVSADGLPLARSAGFPTERADQLAAIASGLTSLTQGASRCFGAGPVRQMIVEMEQGYLLKLNGIPKVSFDLFKIDKFTRGNLILFSAIFNDRV